MLNITKNKSPANFIKGKITELIFDEMFIQEGKVTVIPFGYENTVPEIAQYSRLAKYKSVLDTIRTAPDFALVSNDKTGVYLVEVKYKTKHTDKDILEIAKKIKEKWGVVHLFLATPNGFYFDSCNEIINNNGLISLLTNKWISEKNRIEYHELLMKFIK